MVRMVFIRVSTYLISFNIIFAFLIVTPCVDLRKSDVDVRKSNSDLKFLRLHFLFVS